MVALVWPVACLLHRVETASPEQRDIGGRRGQTWQWTDVEGRAWMTLRVSCLGFLLAWGVMLVPFTEQGGRQGWIVGG